MRINQVLMGFARHDAISNMARSIRSALSQAVESGIYVTHPVGDVDDCRLLTDFPAPSGPDDLIIFHASYGDPLTFKFLISRPERMVVVFHNISPAGLFELVDPMSAAMLHWGWRELELLKDRVVLVVADSQFNADELRRVGFDEVVVIPVGVDIYRLQRQNPGEDVLARFAHLSGAPLVLGVGQLLPHKRVETLIDAQLFLDRFGCNSEVVLVGGRTNPLHSHALFLHAHDLQIPRVHLVGTLSDEELAAVMGCADVFVTASDHEGLCIPVLEAMVAGVPVIASSGGALPETIGGAGIVLPANAGPIDFAEAIIEVTSNEDLRAEMIKRGIERVDSFDPDRQMARFLDLLAEVM